MDATSLAITLFVFVLFVLLALYYFSAKKANDQALLLLIFGIIFLVASFTDLLDFILPLLFLLFFISIFSQYLRKKQLHQLVWSISLFMFFLTTLFQAIAKITGLWSSSMLQTYYVLASFQVLLLGLGELYLLSKRNIISKNTNIVAILVSGFFWMLFGFIYLSKNNEQVFLVIALIGILVMLYGIIDFILAIIHQEKYQLTGFQYSNFVLVFSVLMFILAVYYTFTTPFKVGFDLSAINGVQPVIDSVWNTYSVVRGFAPLFTVNGAMFIFIGSIYSYILWQLSIKRKQGSFSFGTGIFNIYFAIGVAIFTAGGSLSQLGGGLDQILYISELLGGMFMYFGFLESDKISMEMIMDIVTLRFLHKSYEQSEMPSH